jgi:hypothetical protein
VLGTERIIAEMIDKYASRLGGVEQTRSEEGHGKQLSRHAFASMVGDIVEV